MVKQNPDVEMKQEDSKQAEAAFLEGEANFFLQNEPNGDNG